MQPPSGPSTTEYLAADLVQGHWLSVESAVAVLLSGCNRSMSMYPEVGMVTFHVLVTLVVATCIVPEQEDAAVKDWFYNHRD